MLIVPKKHHAKYEVSTYYLLREGSFVDFVRRNVPGTFLLDPYPPSLRNVKFQNDPLIMVSITVSRANGPGPKHAPRIILAGGDQG